MTPDQAPQPHITAIYEGRELSIEATIRQHRIVQTEGGKQVERPVDCYNLDMDGQGEHNAR